MQNRGLDDTAEIYKQKKTLKMIIWCVIAASLIISAAYYVILTLPEKKTESTDFSDALTDYEFYPILDENIFEDEDYTKEMRKIRFFDLTVNLSEHVLNEESVSEFDASVKFMYDYINHIINGNTNGYNSCFSNAYYKKVYPKPDFTMQRLYDIELSKLRDYYDENGMRVYVFKLDYKIMKNNGTFRRDIDSSTSRTKTIYVTDREGKLAIDGEVIQHIQHNDK